MICHEFQRATNLQGDLALAGVNPLGNRQEPPSLFLIVAEVRVAPPCARSNAACERLN
jgi:hypothetical protein